MMIGSMDSGMGGSGMGGMGDMPGGIMVEEEGFLMSFFHKLPLWGQGILVAVLVIALAWIAGIIIGKLYASVKYPDPEKPSLINPLLKIGLGAAVVICGFWIYSSFTKPDVPEMPVDDPNGIVDESMPEGEIPEGEVPEGEAPEGEAPEGKDVSDKDAQNGSSSVEDTKEAPPQGEKTDEKPAENVNTQTETAAVKSEAAAAAN